MGAQGSFICYVYGEPFERMLSVQLSLPEVINWVRRNAANHSLAIPAVAIDITRALRNLLSEAIVVREQRLDKFKVAKEQMDEILLRI